MNKQEKLEQEFNNKGNEIVDKSIRAYEKLEKEYGKKFNMVVMVRMENGSWTSILNSKDNN